MTPFLHIDTFSGIGGFALAAEWAGFTTALLCEIEDYCRQVLAKRFPGIPCHDDIRTLTDDLIRRYGIGAVHLLTGGPPCQPASVAGQRKGSADDRWLWPEFLRLVSELRPLWVLAENPRGLCSLTPHGLDWVVGEFAAAGYQCEVYLLAASDVGAPHQRERVWIVAHADPAQWRADTEGGNVTHRSLAERDETSDRPCVAHQNTPCDAGNSSGGRLSGQSRRRTGTEPADGYSPVVPDASDAHRDGKQQPQGTFRKVGRWTGNGSEQIADADGTGRRELRRREPVRPQHPAPERSHWAEAWPDVASRLCRVDDGLPRRVDRHRVPRLKALGNAIVPQDAYILLSAIHDLIKETR